MIIVMIDIAQDMAKHQGTRTPANRRLSTTGRTSDTGIRAHALLLHWIFALQKSGSCEV